MKSILITRPGGPEVLTVGEREEPSLRPEFVRVRVAGAAVNPTDIFVRAGGLDESVLGPLPWTPGMDVAGVVESVNPGSRLRVGDRVMAVTMPGRGHPGAQSELVLLPEASVVGVPAQLDLLQASSLPMNSLTAVLIIDKITERGAGSMAITGATGMLGILLVELAKHEGLHVVAAGRSEDRQMLLDAGASEVVERSPRVSEQIRVLHPYGVDAAVDASLQGAETLRAVRDGGLLVAVRPWTLGAEREVEVVSVLVSQFARDHDRLERVCALINAGVFTPRVSHIYAPEEIAEAHRSLETGGLRGRPVISFDA